MRVRQYPASTLPRNGSQQSCRLTEPMSAQPGIQRDAGEPQRQQRKPAQHALRWQPQSREVRRVQHAGHALAGEWSSQARTVIPSGKLSLQQRFACGAPIAPHRHQAVQSVRVELQLGVLCARRVFELPWLERSRSTRDEGRARDQLPSEEQQGQDHQPQERPRDGRVRTRG